MDVNKLERMPRKTEEEKIVLVRVDMASGLTTELFRWNTHLSGQAPVKDVITELL